jgi:hypothetical protein
MAAELVVDGATPRTAITKDISELGLLLLTRARLDLEQRVVVRIYLPGDELRSVDVPGKVVRMTEMSDEEKGIWRNKVAFVFDKTQHELAQQFKELATEQAKIYKPLRKRK